MANYIKATNFTAKDSLPTGNPSKIIKGTEIDVEYTAIATAIASKADTNSPTFTGTPTAPTATSGTNNTQIATTAFVAASSAASFPAGGIIMWSGSIAAIPSGWLLCDGTNGTPNLRDRFVIGAGSSYAVAATGGSKDAIVVSHTHTASTNSAGSHNHTVEDVPLRANDTDRGSSGSLFSLDSNTTRTTSSAGTHSHTVTVNSTGSSGTNANLPPYYALAYIMKA
jgi:microcystin-dependent protein